METEFITIALTLAQKLAYREIRYEKDFLKEQH